MTFADFIQEIEQRLFADQLDETDPMRMKNIGPYSWYYRPSHHAETGLVTEADMGKRLLSVGAYPAYLERVLIELGMPAKNMLIADSDPDILVCAPAIPSVQFDMLGAWPNIGTFDRIIFPESLCIAIGDQLPAKDPVHHSTDAREAELLSHVMRQALARLRARGIIRANGPMSHPKVVDLMSKQLQKEGFSVQVDYERFFLSVCRTAQV